MPDSLEMLEMHAGALRFTIHSKANTAVRLRDVETELTDIARKIEDGLREYRMAQPGAAPDAELAMRNIKATVDDYFGRT